MTDITEAQVEAAAKGIFTEEKNTSLSGERWPDWGDLCAHEPESDGCESEGSKYAYLRLARAALEAAHAAAPVVDVEKLEEALRASWEPARGRPGVSIKRLAELSADHLNGGAK